MVNSCALGACRRRQSGWESAVAASTIMPGAILRPLHLSEQLPAEIVLLEQVVGTHPRGLVRNRLIPEIDADKAAHCRRIVECLRSICSKPIGGLGIEPTQPAGATPPTVPHVPSRRRRLGAPLKTRPVPCQLETSKNLAVLASL